MTLSPETHRLTIGLAAAAFALAVAPLLACGSIEVGDLEESPGEGAAELLVGDSAPKPGAEAAGWSETCGKESPLVFSCAVTGGKEIAVCGSLDDDPPWMRYRFGTPAQPELLFPDKPEESLGNFTVEERSYVRSRGDVLSFEHDGKTYEVTDMIGGGGGPDAAANNFAGLRVLQGDKELSSVACEGDPVTDWPKARGILDPISP